MRRLKTAWELFCFVCMVAWQIIRNESEALWERHRERNRGQ